MAKKQKKNSLKFPASILKPISDLLQSRLKLLENRRKDISSEDPFENEGRVISSASMDTDAEEQFGHDRTAAIKEQLDRKIAQTKKAIKMIKKGDYGFCEICGEMIDTDRLMIYPEATLCIKCEAKKEKK